MLRYETFQFGFVTIALKGNNIESQIQWKSYASIDRKENEPKRMFVHNKKLLNKYKLWSKQRASKQQKERIEQK